MNRVAYVLLLGVLGCSSTPADVSGDYTMAVTDEANGCNLQNWTMGDSSTGIPVTITQDTKNVTINITGATGAYVAVILGTSMFMGTVDGDNVSATLFGTRSATMGGCAYTYNADLEASLNVDELSGTIAYTPQTNGSPDCSTIMGCSSTQNFNGTRAPQ